MIKKLKAAIARKCRQLANKWDPQERFDPSAIRLTDGGTLELRKFKSSREYTANQWAVMSQRVGPDKWLEVSRSNLRDDLAPAIVDELERRGMVVFDAPNRYDGKVFVQATISLYLKA